MREIEVKARVRDEASLRAALDAKGIVLGKPVRQRDEVFALPEAYFGGGFNWLRIRSEDDNKHIFTLKRSVTSKHDCIEHETEVQNPDELRNILSEIGYAPFTNIIKIRQKAKFGDYELCLDNVDGLGLFIEAEQVCEHNANTEEVVGQLWGS